MYLRKKMFSETGQHSESDTPRIPSLLYLASALKLASNKKKAEEDERKELEEYRASQKKRKLSRKEIELEDGLS